MKFLLMPDSYKRNLSARQVADAMQKGILSVIPDAEIVSLPISDGGEGFVDCLHTVLGGVLYTKNVTYPLGDIGPATYFIKDKTAVLEIAESSGLGLVKTKDPINASTYGFGELISDAIKNGAKKLIIGLGGSASNDAGFGMFRALGAKFLDKNGNELENTVTSLNSLAKVDLTNLLDFSNIEIICACDVTNPLCGPNGASYVYGPQKGATEETVRLLDSALLNFANVMNINPETLGYGAAGGMGFALMGILGAKFVSGIELVLDLYKVSSELCNTTCIFTGEGQTNSQSLQGKVISGIGNLAKTKNVPVVCISGGYTKDILDKLQDNGITAIFATTDNPMDLSTAIKNAPELIVRQSANVASLIKGVINNE